MVAGSKVSPPISDRHPLNLLELPSFESKERSISADPLFLWQCVQNIEIFRCGDPKLAVQSLLPYSDRIYRL